MLFERFTQADASTSRRFGGTGLGLAISRRLAEIMGDSIEAEPRAGGGSVFRFSIAARAAPLVDPTDPADFTGRRVLVVEDLPLNREILRSQLRGIGVETQEAVDADAAIDAIAAAEAAGTAFDAAIIDGRLGADSGHGLARRIRAREGAVPRLILLTLGGAEGGPPPFGLFDAMLMKPAMPKRLREALHHAFRLRRDRGQQPEAAAPPPKLSALLVEDNPINQCVLTRMLEQAGVAVTVAGQGREALVLAAATRFDVILMDMQMPVMDGMAATRAIRAGDSPNRTTRILGLTAAVGPVYERQCRDAGMDDYLTKPVAKAALLNALDLTRGDQATAPLLPGRPPAVLPAHRGRWRRPAPAGYRPAK